MPLPYSKKETEYKTDIIKCAFLYGRPNAEKRDLVTRMQAAATEHVNACMEKINANPDILLQVLKNDKKDPAVRAFEKTLRHDGWNSAFCQNAFDTAFTILSNRLGTIRHEMMRTAFNIFTSSKVLFAASVNGLSREQMISAMENIIASYKKPQAFHISALKELQDMADDEFELLQVEFMDQYKTACMQFSVPHVRRIPVSIDSRLGRLEPSENIEAPYVAVISDPFNKGRRVAIPVYTSGNSLRRLSQHKIAASFLLSVSGGNVKCSVAYTKRKEKPAPDKTVGVDVGITDCLYVSDGRHYGSMKDAINFYKEQVEPAFAYLSDLRNKRRKILHFLHTHKNLPDDVRRSLAGKVDLLEHMIREAEAPYRKNRRYRQMLEHEVKTCVKAFVKSVDPGCLVALEKLDIREFDKSREANGKLSIFARGLLSSKLMEELNWHGRMFEQVAPDYTSQVCPVCSNLDKKNRDGKSFTCTCCGHKDDADHVGSVNICRRAGDVEIKKICLDARYDHGRLQDGLKGLYKKRNEEWLKAHPKHKKAEPAA